MQSNFFFSPLKSRLIYKFGLPNVKEGFLQDESKGDKNLIHYIPQTRIYNTYYFRKEKVCIKHPHVSNYLDLSQIRQFMISCI